ncbi:MAG: hypothetical protein ABIG52_01335 [Nanoarchaeota archaeon]
MDDFSQVKFPLFLNRHLNFNREEVYDFPLVTLEQLENAPIKNKNTKFGCITTKEPETKLAMVKDTVGHKNLMYFYDGRWINISKLTTEFSLNEKFIKAFNEDLDKNQRYV